METTLFDHPAIQSGVAPFVIALIVAGIFYRFKALAGLAIVSGFVVSVLLSSGISLEPLTSTRKITLLVLIAPILGLLLSSVSYSRLYSKIWLNVFYTLGALAMLWVVWPVLSRHPVDMLIPVAGYLIYAAWMVGVFFRLSEATAVAAGTAATASGFGVGLTALIGASALLGQMGLSLGAAGAAYLFIQLFFKRGSQPGDLQDGEAGFTVTLTSGFMAALILPAAVVYAKVPWIVLPLIAIVPLVAFYPFEDESRIWKNTVTLLAVMALPVAYAIYLTLQSAGTMVM